MSEPTPRACAVRDDDSVSMEIGVFRDLRAGQSTSVGGITFGCDDATEPEGETPQTTLVEENRPLLSHVEHVDSEQASAVAIKFGLIVANQLCFQQPTQQPSTITLPINSPTGA
jgi:hypothetical protein